ncbi:MAG: hypothetical protein R6X02_01740 [Enhygromyxa sp.]
MVCRSPRLAPVGTLLALLSGCSELEDDPHTDGLGETGLTETGFVEPDDSSPGEPELPDDPDIPFGGVDRDLLPPVVGDGDGDPGDGDGDDDPLRCWDDTWSGGPLPHVILGNTLGLDDDSIGSCGIGAAPDYQLGFVAPWSGSFMFDTGGSSFDTVLYVHEGKCGEAELTCNDDFIGLDSRVVVELAQGEVITLSVDGTGAFEQGLFKLTISEAVVPVCEPEFIPPNLPAVVLDDTTGADSQLASGCGGEGAPERVYQFVAPGPGSYRFDTFGSSFDTVLYLLDECDGPPLACNDDAGFDLQSELVVQLAGGEQVLVVVDGFGPGDAGHFLLNVAKL